MTDKLRSNSDTNCHRRLAGTDSWEDLSRELRHSLNRFSSPSFLHSPPSPPEQAPLPSPPPPPRHQSAVVLGTPFGRDICVGPDDTTAAPPTPQLPNPPAEAPCGGPEYEHDRPTAPYDAWDKALPARIEVRYIPMSLQWFQGRFHDRTQMVGSFKKDCRSWLWKNRPADFKAFTGDVVESATVVELTPSAHLLPSITEHHPPSYVCDADLDIPSE